MGFFYCRITFRRQYNTVNYRNLLHNIVSGDKYKFYSIYWGIKIVYSVLGSRFLIPPGMISGVVFILFLLWF